MSLEGRVALVTGASRGIGRACALALSQEGVRVAVGFRQDKDGAEATARECDGVVVNIDVTSNEGVSAAFDEVENSLGTVGILVNNAGMTNDKLMLRMTEKDFTDVIDTNLTGAFRTTKRAMPKMLGEKWGRVISIGSVVGQTGNPAQANYAASKAGLVGFMKSIAREVASHGITANVVAPGYVETEMTASLTDAQREGLLSRIGMKRTATPEEIAEAVRFCARAGYLTGQVIAIDGGLT